LLKFIVLLGFTLLCCQPTHISPHTKKGQSRLKLKSVITPYHIQYLTLDGRVPFNVNWEGQAQKMIIEVQYIMRPTSPRRRFPIYLENLSGNHYTVYRDLFDIKNLNKFEGHFSVFERGDYRVKVTIINQYWVETRNSHFKVS